ncbi:class II aldolase/adducin family protein [Leucobacter sp. CSA1]|uniref:Class II aldolase/adducin family protein n=1 Tax=Leucobacter chromiisoli TaxID=2796471 RepID=A0A934Q4M0_9MICO|nr:class II aldolase/adducin family protein [Leucobacter chromiisoli]MBK0417533.1 class II aldolase/adducin family protein [Leucobacter chromiisoli]
MTERDQALNALVELSRRLGDPSADAAILGEGNTSVRIGEREMLVKASGAVLGDAEAADFVPLDLGEAERLIGDPDAGDTEVSELFGRVAEAHGRRPSVEALLHAVVYASTDARVVAHSHPTDVNALLCSERAELLIEGGLFPDQIVVLGATPLLVDYIDPGIRLAREVALLLAEHIERHGESPRVIYLRNHGMFALGASAAEVLGITRMAQKCARVLIGAAAVGGVQFMPAEEVVRIDSRPDEQFRRGLLSN